VLLEIGDPSLPPLPLHARARAQSVALFPTPPPPPCRLASRNNFLLNSALPVLLKTLSLRHHSSSFLGCWRWTIPLLVFPPPAAGDPPYYARKVPSITPSFSLKKTARRKICLPTFPLGRIPEHLATDLFRSSPALFVWFTAHDPCLPLSRQL